MTLDEAIKHCLETAEQLEERANTPHKCEDSELQDNACRECAADHRQLAEWLTDYKELKNSIGAVKLSNMKEALALIRTLKAELCEAKQLLKAAVKDIHSRDYCNGCIYESAEGKEQYLNCEYHNCFKWRYADEAEKLLND